MYYDGEAPYFVSGWLALQFHRCVNLMQYVLGSVYTIGLKYSVLILLQCWLSCFKSWRIQDMYADALELRWNVKELCDLIKYLWEADRLHLCTCVPRSAGLKTCPFPCIWIMPMLFYTYAKTGLGICFCSIFNASTNLYSVHAQTYRRIHRSLSVCPCVS